MARHKRLRLLPILGALTASAGLLAQTKPPQQPPTFKSRVDLVRIDVTVVDNRTGKPVTDLTEADFTVTENKVTQAISSFSREVFAAEAPGPAAAAPPVRSTDGLAPANRRVFLLVPNLSHAAVEGPVRPLDGALRFIRERLLPQDLVAIMAFNRATDFTTDHEQVAQLIERLRPRYRDIVFELGLHAVRTQGRNEDIPADIQSQIDAIFEPAESSTVKMRSATSLILGSEVFRALDDTLDRRPWNRMMASFELLRLHAGIEYLRPLAGEKHLVALTGSLLLPVRIMNMPPGLFFRSADDEARLAVQANDAGVAIDVISTAGVGSGGADQFGLMSSQNVARLTGGMFTGVRTAESALTRLDEASRAGYVLGYAPSNPALDGRYRNVTVSVNRRDVTVLHRHGYTARADVAPVDLREVITNSRIRSSAATDVEERGIRVEAKASIIGLAAARQLRIDLVIDASRLALAPRGNRREGAIDLAILCGDEKQEVTCRLQQRMEMNLDAARYDQAMKSGIPYSTRIPLTGPARFVKVIVYDYGADLIGTKIVKLN